jgi:hypothetical protein
MTAASIPLRPVIREIMQAAPARRWSEKALLMQAKALVPDIEELDLTAALTWNLGKGYVDSEFNREMEVDVWFLTERGRKA